MTTLGHRPNEKELINMMNALDKDGSGCIDFQEFTMLLGPKMFEPIDQDVEQMMIDVFRMIDKDNDGYIAAHEVYDLMKHLGSPITMDQADAMIYEADLDNDGTISYVELISMMTPTQEQLEQMPKGNHQR
jgi:Ca2+-binding EF-hand superfamily protein